MTFVIGFKIVAFISVVHSYDVPIRQTLYGHVRGQVTSRVPGRNIEEYLGVPYASPPVGYLRFKVGIFLLQISLLNIGFIYTLIIIIIYYN